MIGARALHGEKHYAWLVPTNQAGSQRKLTLSNDNLTSAGGENSLLKTEGDEDNAEDISREQAMAAMEKVLNLARQVMPEEAASFFPIAPTPSSLTDFKTIKGKEYKNATVSRVEPDGIVFKTKSGISKVYFTELPEDVQKRFGYDAAKIAELQRQQAERIAAAERERGEKVKNADADLQRAAEQFQAAEQRAAQSYQSAAKGALSGQIFVSTRGGENFKFGAIPVSLFDRNAIDALIPAAKIYADIKIQQLSPAVDRAKATLDQAEAEEEYWSKAYGAAEESYPEAIRAKYRAQEEYQKILASCDLYYSGAFYFWLLVSPLQTAETDADGKFTIEVPKTGAFVVAAKAERYVPLGEHGYTEHYYWLQPISLDGEQQRVQNLSNNNLTSTTGSSSLIHTQD